MTAITEGSDRFELTREEADACYGAIKEHFTEVERSRNCSRIAATLMTLHEDGWITVEEAAVRAEYIESILWEALHADGIVARQRATGRA